MDEQLWYFDASTLAFYPYSMKPDYVAAGTWPASGVDVNNYTREDFMPQNAPNGMTLGADGRGFPTWVPIAVVPPTDAEKYAEAEDLRKRLIAETESISPIVWASMGDPGELSKLQTAWIEYRTALKNLPSLPGYPNVTWPVKPEIS